MAVNISVKSPSDGEKGDDIDDVVNEHRPLCDKPSTVTLVGRYIGPSQLMSWL